MVYTAEGKVFTYLYIMWWDALYMHILELLSGLFWPAMWGSRLSKLGTMLKIYFQKAFRIHVIYILASVQLLWLTNMVTFKTKLLHKYVITIPVTRVLYGLQRYMYSVRHIHVVEGNFGKHCETKLTVILAKYQKKSNDCHNSLPSDWATQN